MTLRARPRNPRTTAKIRLPWPWDGKGGLKGGQARAAKLEPGAEAGDRQESRRDSLGQSELSLFA